MRLAAPLVEPLPSHLRDHTPGALVPGTDAGAHRARRPVTVVFRKHADTLARRFMDYLHIPAIYTDVHVQGTIIDPDRGSIYGSIVLCEPKLFDFPIDDYDPSTPDKIFISRKGVRSLTNDAEVSDYLRSRGFVRYTFEDLSLSKQLSLMRNAGGEWPSTAGHRRPGLQSPRVRAGGTARRRGAARRALRHGYVGEALSTARGEVQRILGGRQGPGDVPDRPRPGQHNRPRSHANSPFRIHIGSLEEALDAAGTAG